MQGTLEISFRDVNKTPELEALIRQKVSKLERFFDELLSCRVTVEKTQKHQRSGSPYRVRIDLAIPNHDMVVRREPGEGNMHDSVSTVLRSAFDAARRQLQALTAKQRGAVKVHPGQEMTARVVRLNRAEGYGFIRTNDTDEEVYFHRNAVLNDEFERLEVGTGVRFNEEDGEKGPQATTVQVVNKPGVRQSRTGEEAG